MTKEQLKLRTKARRREQRDLANWAETQLRETLGVPPTNGRNEYDYQLAASRMPLKNLGAFLILKHRLNKLAVHMFRYYRNNLDDAWEQRREALTMRAYDVMAEAVKAYQVPSTSVFDPLRNGKGCLHGVYHYASGVLYCTLCGTPRRPKLGDLANRWDLTADAVRKQALEDDYAIVESAGVPI